ncbi:unnamed protein product [Acanthoscelides obtectus]|uniref:Uncharacterized protein n=1 Tax=Acanthoscelides obtectus TaxID=200917 RepID=A0A9P0LWX9_ACAOB|nr:unnamed protein product [Acanthoscelides obtectus]CAK1649443.1 hypothetical protein AOBTE_LOCUS16242 [Acanthoscelides obtectus]
MSFYDPFCSSASFFAAVRVFTMSMATVIGPTPPGTGVMWPAIALMMMSALLAKNVSSSGGVFLWHKMTVASCPGSSFLASACNSSDMGRPTFFDLPHTTTFLPKVFMCDLKLVSLVKNTSLPRARAASKPKHAEPELGISSAWAAARGSNVSKKPQCLTQNHTKKIFSMGSSGGSNHLVADIFLTSGIFTNQHGNQAWYPVTLLDPVCQFLMQFFVNIIGNFLAVDELGSLTMRNNFISDYQTT